jgi:hypothetical protein
VHEAEAGSRPQAQVRRTDWAAVLDVTATGIARIVVFGDPGLVTLFGLPPIDSPLEVIRS